MDKEPPYISDDFQIGPEGAFEYTDDELYEFSLWEVTLLDGLNDLDDI
jgi:hypothetical protein